MNNDSSLPAFEFGNGYTLKCIDFGDDGMKLALSHDHEETAAILLPPEECGKFMDWQRRRIGKKISTPPAFKHIVEEEKKQASFMEKVLSDMEVFYDIIEDDTGVTTEQIADWRKSLESVVFARDVLCFVLRLRFKLSAPKIAALLGAASHASALLSFKKFDFNRINEGLYQQSDLLKIYEDARRRYKKVIVFRRLR